MPPARPTLLGVPVLEEIESRSKDPELLSLEREIATLRLIRDRLIEQAFSSGDIDPSSPALQSLIDTTDRIGRLVERHHRLLLERRTMVPAHRVARLLQSLAEAIKAKVQDRRVIEVILYHLEEVSDLT